MTDSVKDIIHVQIEQNTHLTADEKLALGRELESASNLNGQDGNIGKALKDSIYGHIVFRMGEGERVKAIAQTVLDGVGYSYGVNGQGGTSLDSSNVVGQAFPAMNWFLPTTTGWSPEWAISMNVTSAVQYADVGVLGGKGWTMKFLTNVRSNSASGRSMMGTTYNASPYAGIGFGWSTAMAGWFWYSQALITPGTFYTGWTYVDCVPDADINYMNFTTNGIFVGKAGPWNASGANTINYRIGLRSGTTTYCCCWDFVRAQFTDPNNVVQRDLFATPVGTFWDSVTKSFFTFGTTGVGGTSLDSTNIIKQTIPAQTWK